MKNKILIPLLIGSVMSLTLTGILINRGDEENKNNITSSDSNVFYDIHDIYSEKLHLADIRREDEKLEYQRYIEELEQARIFAEQEKLRKELEELARKQSVGFNLYNLRVKSNLTTYELKSILPQSMKHIAEAIIYAENMFNVNAFFLASLIAEESSWATSSRALGASNNLTGMAVYNRGSAGMYFESHQECVIYTGQHIGNNYLSQNGIYYSGVSIWNVNARYAANQKWSSNISSIMSQLLNTYKKNN